MKKVRIMLAAIAVLGVVGGALAFKAKNPTLKYCYVGTTTTSVCTTFVPINSTIAAGQAIHYTTTNVAAACPGYDQCKLTAGALVVE
jgi:hypothetical protein